MKNNVNYSGQEDDDDFEKVQIILMDIQGNVWIDKEENDIKIENALVKLTNITDKTTHYTRTDEKGHYIFRNMLISKQYTLEFEYDGQTYIKSSKTTSYAKESAVDRQNLNNRFYEITKDGARNIENSNSVVNFEYDTRKRSITSK